MTRWIDQAASSAVTGFPDEKVAPLRRTMVMVRLSSETVQDSASIGRIVSSFAGESCTRLS
jgi:hypothetical protein